MRLNSILNLKLSYDFIKFFKCEYYFIFYLGMYLCTEKKYLYFVQIYYYRDNVLLGVKYT